MINQQSNTVAPSDQQQHTKLVSTLVESLDEKLFTGPHRQISLIVQIIGGQAAQDLAQRAKTAHKDGMLTNDKSKKRTPGGCFFALFKAECTPEQLAQFYALRSAGQRRAQRDDKPTVAATKPTTQLVVPQKPQANQKKPAPTAQPPQAKKPVAAVKAGLAGQSGKRKPIAPTVNRQKSGSRKG